MKNQRYAQFEDEHRGGTREVSAKLNVYKPILIKYKKYKPNARLIDLGCGRGEFLKIAQDLSINSLGIDSNDSMLQSAVKLGLNVEKGEALKYLIAQEDDSVDILTAFHLIEHFHLDYLLKIITEITRVMKPGGLLILETPNPENIIVSTCNFYMDMTHVKPLPAELLKFIFRSQKFNNINVWGLNSKKNLSKDPVSLIDVLGGVSPDYALLALNASQEPPPNELINELTISHGFSLNQLANMYEQRWSGEIEKVINRMDKSQIWIKDELFGIENRLSSNLLKLYAEIREEISSIQEQTHFYQTELQLVTNSRSWKITYPLRYLGKFLRRSRTLVKHFFFDFKNLPFKIFFKSYRRKILQKILPSLFNNRIINRLGSTNSYVSSKEKKFLSILEKINKEK
ncbi:MAG: hypothetical protein CBC01_01735 [Betaproteobacteria bacterium TMED41]|nr:MAG: hypothetical protein CBC01_01735 [Betaproteobacteria bacterium TMED41]